MERSRYEYYAERGEYGLKLGLQVLMSAYVEHPELRAELLEEFHEAYSPWFVAKERENQEYVKLQRQKKKAKTLVVVFGWAAFSLLFLFFSVWIGAQMAIVNAIFGPVDAGILFLGLTATINCFLWAKRL